MKKVVDFFKALDLKKKIILCVVVVILIGSGIGCFILTRSNDGYGVNVSKGSTKLVTGDVTITKQDYFDYLVKSYGVNNVITDALNEIANKEVKEDDDYQDELDSLVETYSSYSTEGLDSYAVQSGYKDGDEFTEKYLKPMAKLNLLNKQYIEKNLDTLLDDYDVCSFKLIIASKESEALKIISKAKTEEKFDEYMAKEDYSEKAQDVGIVTKNNSSLDSNLIKKLDAISKSDDGIYSKAIKLSDDTYAVVYVYDHEHKDTDNYVSTLSSDTDIQEDIKATYLKKYNFKVYSKKLKKEIKSTYSNYID